MSDELETTSTPVPTSDQTVPGLEMELTDLSIDKLIQRYVEIRDELSAETKKYNQFEANAKDMMSRIGMALKDKGDSLGVNTFSTNDGTAYRNIKKSYRVQNWDEILDYMKATGNWQMLEKRIAKLATQEIHEATKVIPPGVEYVVEEMFLVRRPSK